MMLPDDKIRKIVQEEWSDHLDSIDLDQIPEHKFSDDFEQSMEKLCRKQTLREKMWKHTGRAVAAGLILCLVAFSPLVTVKALRNKVFRFLKGTVGQSEVSIDPNLMQGTLSNGFSWSVDQEGRVLNISGAGEFPDVPDNQTFPWETFDDWIDHVALHGRIRFPDDDVRAAFFKAGKKTITEYIGDGFFWTYNTLTDTITIGGRGEFPEENHQPYEPWNDLFPENVQPQYDAFVISNGITHAEVLETRCNQLQIGWDCQELQTTDNVLQHIAVNVKNPYFSSFDGCLYTKDRSKILMVPEQLRSMDFPEELKVIGADSFSEGVRGEIVLPQGVEVIETNAFAFIRDCTVILPDTLTRIDAKAFPEDNTWHWNVIYSRQNAVAAEALPEQLPQVQVVDSVEPYYQAESAGSEQESSEESQNPEVSRTEEPERSAFDWQGLLIAGLAVLIVVLAGRLILLVLRKK